MILPAANTRDLQALPDNVKDAITFIPVSSRIGLELDNTNVLLQTATLEEVLTAAFPGGLNLTPPTPTIEHSKL